MDEPKVFLFTGAAFRNKEIRELTEADELEMSKHWDECHKQEEITTIGELDRIYPQTTFKAIVDWKLGLEQYTEEVLKPLIEEAVREAMIKVATELGEKFKGKYIKLPN